VTCEEIRGLLSAYADGELDLVRGVEIERHLEGCPGCAAALDRTRSLSRALADPALYYRAPPDLQRRVRASVRLAAGSRNRRAWRPLVAVAAAAALVAALVAAALWGVASGRPTPPADELLAREVVASHVRSLMLERHRVDIESSDQHTVKPWFIGKVDVAPEVEDLSTEGFPLIGGRLDYIDGRPAAALVYERKKHAINVFIFRVDGKDRSPEVMERQGYHLIRWIDNGRMVWVVSDLNAKELREFAELLRH
jgi:anti-sigma factor RsiW